jgi:hypothetical protein
MSIIYDEQGNVIGDDGEPPVTADPAPQTPSALSLDYYRQKIVEFQTVMDAMDGAANVMRVTIDDDISPGVTQAMQDALAQYELKKGAFRTAAEAINFAVNGANQIGAKLPTLRANTLGLAPVVLAAISGAVAAVAALIVWGRAWINEANNRLKIQLESVTDPAQRERLALQSMQLDSASRAASASPLASVAGIVKWVAIGALAWFAYRAWSEYQK